MPQRLRVFISSPGDVPDERLRADLVVDKLSQEFGRFVTLDTYRWEHEPMLASGHFQDAIEPPSQADIVVLILWSRLGTKLPARTAAREYRGLDGRAPVTGTEWEYEDALQAAKARGAPDILAFRNVSPAAIDTRDPELRSQSIAQLDALDAFWKRHFADRGVFLAAFDEYHTLDEFARRLEESLRRLIERRLAALSAETPIVSWPGAPFRGLEAYEFEHEPIFFGRDGLVAKTAEQLAGNARAGTAFLLVSGPSGSGKSSVVKAALVPRLMKPQRIQGAAFLRRAVFRPGDGGGDPILGLVAALTRGGDDGVGLPELLAPGQSAEQLAAHLRAAVDAPGFVFAGALARLTEDARRDGRLLAYEEAKLIVVVDQLEELFTAGAIGAEDRALFVRLIGNLARSGAVWVVVTLRADFWHRAIEIPELAVLSEGLGRLDVSPPSPAELGEMIRKPAQAAGLDFETDPETGLGLDAVLAEDASSEPGVLPLLSFTLDVLYAEDVLTAGGRALNFATYRALGGLDGAIATRADEIVAALPPAAQATVPRVLRALATISGAADQIVTARAAPLANFPEGGTAREVVDALTAARLLVTADEPAGATVRLAHEALVSRWQRARDQLLTDRRDLRTRALIEGQQSRWDAASGRARHQLLLRDPDLANGIDLARRWGDEIDPATRVFIRASQNRARRRHQLTAAAAAVFGLVAVAAIYGQYRARQEGLRAERDYGAAKTAVNHLIVDVVGGLRNAQGIRVETLTRVLDTVKKTTADLAAANPGDSELQASTALMLEQFSTVYQNAGDFDRAREAADQSLTLFRTLAAANPKNQVLQFMVSDDLHTIGSIEASRGNNTEALKAMEQSLDIRRQLAAANPDNAQWRGAVAEVQSFVDLLKGRLGDTSGQLTDYETSLASHRALAASQPQNPMWRGMVTVDLIAIGNAQTTAGDRNAALAAFTEALAIDRQLVAAEPANSDWASNTAAALDRIAEVEAAKGDREAALVDYDEALEIQRKLTQSDAGKPVWQSALAGTLRGIGTVRSAAGDPSGALAAYQELLGPLRKLAAAEPADAARQAELATMLHQVGNLRTAAGDPAGAIAAFTEAIELRRKLVTRDPGKTDWAFELSSTLNQLANVNSTVGKRDDAMAEYEEGLTILQKLLATEPDNKLWQRASGIRISGIGDIKRARGDDAGARTAYEESLAISRKLAAAEPGNLEWQIDLVGKLIRVANLADKPTALADLKEAHGILEALDRDGKLSLQQKGVSTTIGDRIAALEH